jgi:tetratricopeptide (TPR) repeat protein
LRHYGAEHLARDPEEEAEIQRSHCLHFTRFLQQREQEISAGEQRRALEAIGDEIENVRAAWRYAVRNENSDAIQSSFGGLFRFYLVRGLYQEGESAFGAAVGALEAGARKDRRLSIPLGQLLARQAAFNTELSQFERADELLERSLALLNEHGTGGETAFALSCLGSLCRNRGEYERARVLMQESLTLYLENEDRLGAANALSDLGTVAYRLGHYSEFKKSTESSLEIRRELNDQQGIARCLKDLGRITYRLGDYEEAWRLFNESLRLCEAIGDRWGVAACSNNLGNVAERRGDLTTARDLYEQSVAIKRGIGHRMSMATSLYNLGKIARRRQEFERSVELYQEALAIIREIGDQWSLSNAICGLAEVQVEMGHYDQARGNFRQSLAIAREIGSEVLVEAALVETSNLIALEGDPEGAVEVLAMIVERRSKEQEIQDRAEQLLADLRSQLSAQAYAAACALGKDSSIQDILVKLDLEA